MLLQTEHSNANGHSAHGTTSRLRNGTQSAQYQHHPRLMDSPTLARVERAMLRHDEGVNREGQDLIRAGYTQSLLSTSNYGKEATHAIKRGLLWQQRDKLFSRWKERYFILTRDYLHCFRRASGADRISEMGQFLFKVKLVDVDRVEWENKKTYSTVALVIGRDGKIYLRAADGLEDWFELLEECMLTSKERRRALRHSHDGRPKNNNNNTSSLDDWLAARQKFPMGRLLVDNTSTPKPEVTLRRREWSPRDEDWDHPTLDNRLSRVLKAARTKKRVLTDIDINSYDDSTLGAPSVTSYRMSRDVLCIQPPSLRASGSFRSTRDTSQPPKRVANIPDAQCQHIKFRERSYSDIQRIERKPWRSLALANHQ
uniref:PH domain-containing protein n=1 Tax=Dendroctonus ponderosae TaxID=77166 RepID=A0AAR5PFU9_DENPD